MARTSIGGVIAAVLVPRTDAGQVAEQALDQHLGFLVEKGIRQFAVNGATGEFCRVSCEEVALQLRAVRGKIASNAELLCGVGAGSLKDARELAQVASDGGATALLASMPHFFPYKQDDLEAFAGELADRAPLPVLLYNLPQFTSGLETETVLRLLREHENLVGVKDSSGSLEIMRAITREGLPVARIIGNDGALAEALRVGVCDGVVSGVSCVLPEVIQALFAFKAGEAEFECAADLLRTFIEQIDVLPTPWGLKVIAEARALAPAAFPLPLSARRKEQSAQVQGWFKGWLAGALDALNSSALAAAR